MLFFPLRSGCGFCATIGWSNWPVGFIRGLFAGAVPHAVAALAMVVFKLHFQYLCAFDETHHYDYFAITAGPITLRNRFCNRKPSKQVQKIAYNRYREIA